MRRSFTGITASPHKLQLSAAPSGETVGSSAVQELVTPVASAALGHVADGRMQRGRYFGPKAARCRCVILAPGHLQG